MKTFSDSSQKRTVLGNNQETDLKQNSLEGQEEMEDEEEEEEIQGQSPQRHEKIKLLEKEFNFKK